MHASHRYADQVAAEELWCLFLCNTASFKLRVALAIAYLICVLIPTAMCWKLVESILDCAKKLCGRSG